MMTFSKTEPYLYLVPALSILFLFLLFPFFWNVYISLHQVSITSILKEWRFSGTDNFVQVLNDPNFHTSVKVSAIFVGSSVTFQFLIGLLISSLLNQNIRGKQLLIAVVMIPWITSGLIAAFSFKFIFDNSFGIINYFFNSIGLHSIPWLSDPNTVIWSIVIANVWYGTPFTILFLTAGLLSVNPSIYESAKIDGASKLKSFFYLTLPLIKPFILLDVVLITIWSINFFEIPLIMTGGNPLFASTPASLYMYRQAFEFGLLSKGSAAGILLLMINIMVAIIYIVALKKRG
ncbi:carbohydrate ABC transporter permease [Candidatus Nitrosocosmicus agrestis]|jgi:ABC-type sugar transport system permease subunit|uniref:carbohydrate ABC transporter permease n=1 Tax=Candidatus Nitrosocosmicus agrestis TaxID=2563600 RepID=UPI00122DE1FD|nr:sugar ABC transporter permease [Candidatus Nitrosocosmicus sp. SS]KAA2280356.1 sugar ABC transporter permease [Candidatus Nitrosocosmicus sp. SS]KAF0868032.1 sugar ABC transporter permease [Candidatus Nitrosocosmicus sp. SS]MDR4491534.1 sugar ABC transporter permease [Candidatus Nitrosocosmicus sp.]